ncbi:redoxin domain-containing protein [Gaetbulibacter sp. M240]|uniref:redoxin domain-containing protein n=1 Tax=Gaetbulibacter sp. M240 TaxID=3126511 RepID=UPI00374E61AF
MKLKLLFILSLVISSCKDQNNEAKNPNVSETKITAAESETVDIALNVFNFEGLKPLLKKQNDTTYVVNFWATWCAPCVKELPHFETLTSNYKDKKVKVLLVSLDFPHLYDKKLKPFIVEHNLKSEVVALDDPDMNSWIPEVSPEWSGSLPATLIYNNDKRAFYEQSFTYESLENQLKLFLN